MNTNIPTTFYVRGDDSNNQPVFAPAKILMDQNGNPVKDAAWGQTYYGNDGVASNPNSEGASKIYYQIYNADGS